MKRTLTLTILSMLMSFAALAADISGTWRGAFQYDGQDVPVTLNLKSVAATVSGTVDGLPTPAAKIQDGKTEGDAVTFWLMIDYQGSPLKLVYKGKLTGDQIQFTFGTEDGSWGTQLTVKRA